MKKLLLMLGVMVFSASAFALNAQAPANDCSARKASFEKQVASQQKTSFIVQYILTNMADLMANQPDERAQEDAVCYATYRVGGMSLVDFVRANADIFRQVNPQAELAPEVYNELQRELMQFADRVEKLAEQAALDDVVARDNEDWIVQHVLSNLADPMAMLSDEKAAPKARVYKELQVRKQPLVEFAREQAARFSPYAASVAEDLTNFANRVERLAK